MSNYYNRSVIRIVFTVYIQVIQFNPQHHEFIRLYSVPDLILSILKNETSSNDCNRYRKMCIINAYLG